MINSSENKAQIKELEIINLVIFLRFLDRSLNNISNASNRAQIGVTGLKLWLLHFSGSLLSRWPSQERAIRRTNKWRGASVEIGPEV